MNKFNNIALIIDAENIPLKFGNTIIDSISKYNNIIIKRAYADWSNQSLLCWKPFLLKNSILPIHQYSYIKGKNSSDISIVIYVMELLYTSETDTFILVSSDSDFSGLVIKLRESNKYVIGIGESKTNIDYKSCYNEFIELDPQKKQLSLFEIEAAVKDILVANNYIMPITKVNDLITSKFSSFGVKKYGFSKLSSLLNSLESFEIFKKKNITYVKLIVSKHKKSNFGLTIRKFYSQLCSLLQ